MAEDWAAIAAEVAGELGDVGTMAYIMRATAPSDTDTNPTAGATTDHACTVVYDKWSSRQIDGETIRMTDQKVLCSITDIVPAIGDQYWDGTSMDGADRVTQTIVAPLMRLAPGAVDIMYELNVRG